MIVKLTENEKQDLKHQYRDRLAKLAPDFFDRFCLMLENEPKRTEPWCSIAGELEFYMDSPDDL